jgi:hypothetical protein
MKLIQLTHIHLRQLSLIFPRFLLVIIHLLILPLLLRIVYEEVTELLVDLLPHVVLRVRYHCPRLVGLGDLPAESRDIVGLDEFIVEFIGREEVALVVWEQRHVVLQDRKHHVPQVEGLTDQLQGLRLHADLRRDTCYCFEKHPG